MNTFIDAIIQKLLALKDWIFGVVKNRIEGFVGGDDFFSFLSMGQDASGTVGLILASAFILATLLFFWYLFALIRKNPEEPKGVLMKRLMVCFLIGFGILMLGPALVNFLGVRLSFV